MRLHSFLLVLCLAACGRTPGQISTSPEVPNPTVPPDQFIQVGDVRIHYLDWGGSGELLLFVHGLTQNAHAFNGIAPHFTNSYHVVAMTRRGHGLSDVPSTSPSRDRLADDIAAVISNFTQDPALLVGHSYAGFEFPRLAERHHDRIRVMIILDGVFDWPGWLETQPPKPGFKFPQEFESFDAFDEWFQGMFPEFSTEMTLAAMRSQAYETEQGTVLWRLPQNLLSDMLALYADWSGSDYVAIKVPVLSIQANQEGFMTANLQSRGFSEDDIQAAGIWAREFDWELKKAGAEQLLRAVPSSTSLLLDSTHHMLNFHRPNEVTRLIEEFLESHVDQ